MKKIILFSALILAVFSGGNAQKKSTIHLSTAEFKTKVFNYETNTDWKYAGDKPCIVDFYASWCGPCKVIAPYLEELASEFAGTIYIYKIDVDAERELAAVFDIQSIPTLLFIPINGMPQMVRGARSKADLKKIINSVLLEKSNNYN